MPANIWVHKAIQNGISTWLKWKITFGVYPFKAHDFSTWYQGCFGCNGGCYACTTVLCMHSAAVHAHHCVVHTHHWYIYINTDIRAYAHSRARTCFLFKKFIWRLRRWCAESVGGGSAKFGNAPPTLKKTTHPGPPPPPGGGGVSGRAYKKPAPTSS